jgi:hypothetical protein
MASEKLASVVFRTGKDFTARWSCQQGDYLLWLRRDPFDGIREEARILDVWSMSDESSVTITNRWQDFPPWFDLHPLEVSGRFIPWMKTRIEARDYPAEPIDGPNIWRVKGGDRIVWVGLSRLGQSLVDGVLGIVDCRAAVAVLGDHPDGPFAFTNFEESPSSIALCTAGLQADRSLGLPRVFDAEWRLG